MVAIIPEYHLLGKRVPVNGLRLGSIINNIQDLTKLNAYEEPTIEKARIYYWHDTDFRINREAALRGGGGVELKIPALEGVGGGGKIDGERSNNDNYSFDAVKTLEFEPVKDDYVKAGQVEGVQTFLKKTKHHPVFYITGIKVGRVSVDDESGPTFEATQVKKLGGILELGVNIPALSIGPKAHGSCELTITQQYKSHNDRIFAIRVRKLKYKKTEFFSTSRKWVDEPYNIGAELAGEDREKQDKEELEPVEPVFDEVEEVGLDEMELKGYKRIIEMNERGKKIAYVVPEDW
ncbi:hypothetical protein F5B19DRAFT_480200 [Rostrohypoxylon terebratum]|nr:hypothetical protein F5B19DRAFT_480200 [Rostrohypoxylon terebratum]